jgi:hypothetical protein
MVQLANPRGIRPGLLAAVSVLFVAGSLLFSACTSGASPNARTPKNSSSTVAKITADWTTFFKGTTPAAEKVSLLQNGSEFASFIKAQAKTSTGKSVSVKVTKVKITSKTSATVTYNLLLSGSTALSGSKGKAIYQDKKWKVSDTSFCALLSLQGTASQVKACAKA